MAPNTAPSVLPGKSAASADRHVPDWLLIVSPSFFSPGTALELPVNHQRRKLFAITRLSARLS